MCDDDSADNGHELRGTMKHSTRWLHPWRQRLSGWHETRELIDEESNEHEARDVSHDPVRHKVREPLLDPTRGPE